MYKINCSRSPAALDETAGDLVKVLALAGTAPTVGAVGGSIAHGPALLLTLLARTRAEHARTVAGCLRLEAATGTAGTEDHQPDHAHRRCAFAPSSPTGQLATSSPAMNRG